MSEKQHDITVINPIVLVFPIMQSDSQQQSHSFLQGLFGILLLLLGFFNIFILTSAVNIMIKSREKQSRAISTCIKLSKQFCASYILGFMGFRGVDSLSKHK